MYIASDDLTTKNVSVLVHKTFGNLPVEDIYTYKGVYLDSKNGQAKSLRLKMVKVYESGNYTQLEIARLFNASRKSVNKWINRYNKHGIEGLNNESNAPKRRERKVVDFVYYWVRDLMTEFPYMGSRRIAHMIEKRFDYKINRTSVNQIMNELRPKKIIPEIQEIEIPKPDMIWHMDMTRMRIFKGKKQYIFGVIDACTRQVHYIMNYSRMASKQSIDCLEWALKKADSVPTELWVDNGRMFTSKAFKKYVAKRGIKLHYTDKGSPWQNGKIEAHFKILKGEWIKFRRYKTPESLNNSLKEFRRWFNCEREIQKLDYRTPNQIEKVFKV
ncbi:MAG: DDE-type integrase/transposase/recombinase [Candidatus Hodarchaeales archaeon]|jgi:putative transposase